MAHRVFVPPQRYMRLDHEARVMRISAINRGTGHDDNLSNPGACALRKDHGSFCKIGAHLVLAAQLWSVDYRVDGLLGKQQRIATVELRGELTRFNDRALAQSVDQGMGNGAIVSNNHDSCHDGIPYYIPSPLQPTPVRVW